MKKSLWILLCAWLVIPVVCAGQTVHPKPVSKKSSSSSAKAASSASQAAVSGFVTQVTKENDGDTTIRICENPKIDGMDRARCIVAKCIAKIPCEVPPTGKPITVKGITRYDAKVGTHWWEIHP